MRRGLKFLGMGDWVFSICWKQHRYTEIRFLTTLMYKETGLFYLLDETDFCWYGSVSEDFKESIVLWGWGV